jgi:bifunctional non-homologous end joining protein LigD
MSKIWVDVEGRRLSLSNLDKVLYPKHGFAKGEVIDYYSRIAPVLVPHLSGRPATRKRYPDGVEAQSFFEKNAPSHTPDWIRIAKLPTPGGRYESLNFVVVDDLPTLVWCANMAALELHVPQWRIDAGNAPRDADLLVYDLDPGPPATYVDACRVACLLRDLLDSDGLTAYPKTSGKKGLHLYVPIEETPPERTSGYAKAAAERLAAEHRDLVVSRMDKRLRRGKVFVDWSQNNGAKTTVAPYSLRAADEPSVSTPVTWAEVENTEAPTVFEPGDVLARVERDGDLLAPLLAEDRHRIP